MSEHICITLDCDRHAGAGGGLCKRHWAAQRRKSRPQCSLDGCSKQAGDSRGWCTMHHRRWKKFGSFDLPRKPTDAERFFPLVHFGDCWEWTAGKLARGYGKFHVDGGQAVLAHRWAWEHLVGPIPTGLVIDHLCMNPCCVNPDHLEPVTQAVNVQRAAQLRRKGK